MIQEGGAGAVPLLPDRQERYQCADRTCRIGSPLRNLSADDLAAAIEVLSSGAIKPSKSKPKSFVRLGAIEGRRWRAALKVLDEAVFLTSFHTKGRAR